MPEHQDSIRLDTQSLKETRPAVSIVIVTHNRRGDLVRLLESIVIARRGFPFGGVETVVVDDASADNTAELVARDFPGVLLIRNPAPRLATECRNQGARASRGEFVFFVDDDNVLHPNAITELYRVLQAYPGVAIAAPFIFYLSEPKKLWWNRTSRSRLLGITSMVEDAKESLGQFPEILESQDATDAFMVRCSAFDVVQGFDSKSFPFHMSEADFCARLRRLEYRIVSCRNAIVFHDILAERGVSGLVRRLHVTSPLRAHYAIQARIRYHKRHHEGWVLLFRLTGDFALLLLYASLIFIQGRKNPASWDRNTIIQLIKGALRISEPLPPGLKEAKFADVVQYYEANPKGFENVDNQLRERYFKVATLLKLGTRLADIGCGAGDSLAHLTIPTEGYVGIDISGSALRIAKARFPDASFMRGSASRLPLRNESVDCVLSLELIEHLPTPEDFLDEARRVLTDQGHLILSTPNGLNYSVVARRVIGSFAHLPGSQVYDRPKSPRWLRKNLAFARFKVDGACSVHLNFVRFFPSTVKGHLSSMALKLESRGLPVGLYLVFRARKY